MSNEDELDEGLRRIFADDRLAIRPRPDAHQLIVAGAKRARRRKDIAMVGGGSLTAVLVIVGGMFVASPRFDGDQQVASPSLTTSSPTSEAATSPPKPPSNTKASKTPQPDEAPGTSGQTRSSKTPTAQSASGEAEAPSPDILDASPSAGHPLGPDGYGQLKLGMSFEKARETGMLADPDAVPPQGCTGYQLAEGQDFVHEVTFSEQDGLSVITATGARTPEGIGIGSSREEVESAYPDSTKNESGYFADTGSGGWYRLVINEGSTVEAFLLVRKEQDCGKY